MDSLQSLGLLDDMINLIRNLGWVEYVKMQCTSYNYLMLEFLSSLNVDWDDKYRGDEVEVTFHMFNIDHRMSLRMSNALLKLPVVEGAYQDVPTM